MLYDELLIIIIIRYPLFSFASAVHPSDIQPTRCQCSSLLFKCSIGVLLLLLLLLCKWKEELRVVDEFLPLCASHPFAMCLGGGGGGWSVLLKTPLKIQLCLFPHLRATMKRITDKWFNIRSGEKVLYTYIQRFNIIIFIFIYHLSRSLLWRQTYTPQHGRRQPIYSGHSDRIFH